MTEEKKAIEMIIDFSEDDKPMTAYDRLKAARATTRPTSQAYIERIFTERIELSMVIGSLAMTLPSLVA